MVNERMQINIIKILRIAVSHLLAVSLLTACTAIKNPDAPVPVNSPHTTQQQLQAAQHWATVASDMSEQINLHLTKNNLLSKPVFINPANSKTDFNRALNDFLITDLVQKGIKVSNVRSQSIVLDYKAQVIKFRSSRDVLLPSQMKWMTLAGGLVVGRLIADAIDINTFDEVVLTTGLVTDLWVTNKAPKLELVVTSSILADQIYVSRSTSVYYANPEDLHLYEHPKSSKRESTSPFNDPFYRMSR